MRKIIKQEYLVVGLIVALSAAVGLFSVSTRPELVFRLSRQFLCFGDFVFLN